MRYIILVMNSIFSYSPELQIRGRYCRILILANKSRCSKSYNVKRSSSLTFACPVPIPEMSVTHAETLSMIDGPAEERRRCSCSFASYSSGLVAFRVSGWTSMSMDHPLRNAAHPSHLFNSKKKKKAPRIAAS